VTSEERKVLRERCRKEPVFLAEQLGYDFISPHHAELLSVFLRHDGAAPKDEGKRRLFDLSDIKNRLILWPRGHHKTTAVVIAIVQLILNYPDIRILIMQANLKLTRGWLTEIRSHFDGSNPKSRLTKIFPDFETKGTALQFTVPARQRKHLKEATVTAASPRAVSTGQHYDVFFADDLVHTGNFRNIELLDKLENEFSHFVPLIDPGGYTFVTGTRYHYADIYGRIIVRNTDGKWMVSAKPAYDDAGTLLFPECNTADGRRIGFTRVLLDSIQRDDPEVFAAQYLNKILVGKSQIFTEADLLSAVRPTDHAEFPKSGPCFFAVDLAWSQKEYSDQSVIAIGRVDVHGRMWILDVVGGTFSAAQLPLVILSLAAQYRPERVFIEKSPGCEFFLTYLQSVSQQKGMLLPVEAMKIPKTKDGKFLRIAALERDLRDKRLFFTAGIHDFDQLVQEFTQFPKGRHDDRPDCVALLVNYVRQNVAPSALTLSPAKREPWFNFMFQEPEMDKPGMLGAGFIC
jgi:predicted phage terminase large subunit-like protein